MPDVRSRKTGLVRLKSCVGSFLRAAHISRLFRLFSRRGRSFVLRDGYRTRREGGDKTWEQAEDVVRSQRESPDLFQAQVLPIQEGGRHGRLLRHQDAAHTGTFSFSFEKAFEYFTTWFEVSKTGAFFCSSVVTSTSVSTTARPSWWTSSLAKKVLTLPPWAV